MLARTQLEWCVGRRAGAELSTGGKFREAVTRFWGLMVFRLRHHQARIVKAPHYPDGLVQNGRARFVILTLELTKTDTNGGMQLVFRCLSLLVRAEYSASAECAIKILLQSKVRAYWKRNEPFAGYLKEG